MSDMSWSRCEFQLPALGDPQRNNPHAIGLNQLLIPTSQKQCILIQLLLNDRKSVATFWQGSIFQVQVQPRIGFQAIQNCVKKLLLLLDIKASRQVKHSEDVVYLQCSKHMDDVRWDMDSFEWWLLLYGSISKKHICNIISLKNKLSRPRPAFLWHSQVMWVPLWDLQIPCRFWAERYKPLALSALTLRPCTKGRVSIFLSLLAKPRRWLHHSWKL